jgi:hypothetical protein
VVGEVVALLLESDSKRGRKKEREKDRGGESVIE